MDVVRRRRTLQVGPPGKVRNCVWWPETKLLLFNITGNRYCANIDRQHKSNGVYYIVDMQVTWSSPLPPPSSPLPNSAPLLCIDYAPYSPDIMPNPNKSHLCRYSNIKSPSTLRRRLDSTWGIHEYYLIFCPISLLQEGSVWLRNIRSCTEVSPTNLHCSDCFSKQLKTRRVTCSLLYIW